MKYKDLTGRKFGRLTFEKFYGLSEKNQALWQCICECSAVIVVVGAWVTSGNTKSCGCLRREGNNRRHGQSGNTRTPVYQLWLNARARARRDGCKFALTLEDIIIPEFCPLLGVKLHAGTRANHINSPSIDKIKPEAGYVVGNIRVISHRANLIKNNATLEELELIVRNWRSKCA